MPSAVARTIGSCIRLPPLPTTRDLIKLYKLQAIKQLSQNFLMDDRLINKIVKSVGVIDPRDTVLEVGPGPGGITRSILQQQPKRLILVEKDSRFMPSLYLLQECAATLNIQVDIHHADILKFNIEEQIPYPHAQRLHLIGNLPFAISTRLLLNWFKDLSLQCGAFRRKDTCMTLTFQKEVSERICAPLGHTQRSRLSIMSQIWTMPVLKFIIPGKAFIPKPDVDVGVVKLIPLKHPKTDLPFDIVEKVLRNIFNMRQKYCRRGYGTLFPPEERDEITAKLFKYADVEDTLRPYQLSVEECIRLASAYADFVKVRPDIAHYDYRAPKLNICSNIT